MISASAGRFNPSSIFSVAAGNPEFTGNWRFFALSALVDVTDPSSLTGKTCRYWPLLSTTYRSLFTLNDPFLVYTVWLEVRLGFIAKKPCPVIARSSAFSEDWILPCVNCCLIDLRIVPEPIALDAFCKGDVAKISPNSARERLNPVVPTFATLFDVVEMSA